MTRIAIIGKNSPDIEQLVNDSLNGADEVSYLRKYKTTKDGRWPDEKFDKYIVGNIPGNYEEAVKNVKELVGNAQVLGIDNGSYMLLEALGGQTQESNDQKKGWAPVYLEKDSDIMGKAPNAFLGYLQQEKEITNLPQNVKPIATSNGKVAAWENGKGAYGLNFNPEINQYAHCLGKGLKDMPEKGNGMDPSLNNSYTPVEKIVYNFLRV